MCRTSTGSEVSWSSIGSPLYGNRTRRVTGRHDRSWSTDIVELFEDEVEIAKLAASPKVGHALTFEKCVTRRTAPSLDQESGRLIFRSEAASHQTFRDPGATHLVLFPKAAVGRSADERHRVVVVGQVIDRRAVVTEAGKVRSVAVSDRAHQARARGRQQYKRPRDIRACCQLRWTIGELEASRHRSAQFAGQECVGHTRRR